METWCIDGSLVAVLMHSLAASDCSEPVELPCAAALSSFLPQTGPDADTEYGCQGLCFMITDLTLTSTELTAMNSSRYLADNKTVREGISVAQDFKMIRKIAGYILWTIDWPLCHIALFDLIGPATT